MDLRAKVQGILLHSEKPVAALRRLKHKFDEPYNPKTVEEQLLFGHITNHKKCIQYLSHFPKERRLVLESILV